MYFLELKQCASVTLANRPEQRLELELSRRVQVDIAAESLKLPEMQLYGRPPSESNAGARILWRVSKCVDPLKGVDGTLAVVVFGIEQRAVGQQTGNCREVMAQGVVRS